MPVDNKALTTIDRVSNAALRSTANDALSEKVFNQSGDYSNEGIRSINTATENVKSYLKRNLSVSYHTSFLTRDDWKHTERSPKNYEYRCSLVPIKDWPVIKVIDKDVKIVDDRKIFAKDKSIEQIEYVSGYRRKDQTNKSDLPSKVDNELSSVDQVPILPKEIEDIVIKLSIYSAVIRLKDLVGTTRSEQEFGDFGSTVQKIEYDEGYEIRELKKIQNYRFII
jgi:hypothetical protein